MTDVNAYNSSSSARLGWEPSWFGATTFDDELQRRVSAFQIRMGLSPDGMCGPATFRRLFTEREADIDDHLPSSIATRDSNHIVVNGSFVPISWDKVVLWSEDNGLKAKAGSYKSQAGKPKRDVKMFVSHWDAALSSKSCHKILAKRNLSVHFYIDNDATIYQTCDLQHVCYHAGSRRANASSVGVEISNAYYPKYQNWYVKNGYGQRPMVWKGMVHGRQLEPFLGFYPAQVRALSALMQAMNAAFDIPYRVPMAGHEMSTTLSESAVYGHFRGFVHHYHLSEKKIDCAGLDLLPLVKGLEDEN